MKKLVCVVLLSYLWVSVFAQRVSTAGEGKSSLGSLALQLPVGVFARTHDAGAGIGYTWSPKRFGRNVISKKPGLVLDAGAAYFLGKRIEVVGRDFRYGGYTYLHAMAGILFNPWRNAHVALAGGPTMGIYEEDSDVGYGVNLFSAYFFKQNLSFGPLVMFKKHSKADALWSGGMRVAYSF